MRSRISISGCVCPSVRRSVRPLHTRWISKKWDFRLNWNKIASGTCNYAIRKTIQIQVRKQIARTHLMSELCQTCFSTSIVQYLQMRIAYSPLMCLDLPYSNHLDILSLCLRSSDKSRRQRLYSSSLGGVFRSRSRPRTAAGKWKAARVLVLRSRWSHPWGGWGRR